MTHPHVDLSVEDIRSQIAAERLQIAQRSQWRAYRKQGCRGDGISIPIPTGIPIGIPMGIPIPTEPEVSTLITCRPRPTIPTGRF